MDRATVIAVRRPSDEQMVACTSHPAGKVVRWGRAG